MMAVNVVSCYQIYSSKHMKQPEGPRVKCWKLLKRNRLESMRRVYSFVDVLQEHVRAHTHTRKRTLSESQE